MTQTAGEMVQQLRSFNRLVTQRVGALDDRFLARGRPLGEARVLWEIGEEGCDVRLLRARLGVDSGYLSRLLRSLEAAGLAEVVPSEGDRRVRTARLTAEGLAEREVLDRRSDELARVDLRAAHRVAARASRGGARRGRAAVQRRARPLRDGRRDEPEAQRCCRPTPPSSTARAVAGAFVARDGGVARHAAAAARALRGRHAARRADRLRRAEASAGRARRAEAHVGRRAARAGSASAAGCSASSNAARPSTARARSGSRRTGR